MNIDNNRIPMWVIYQNTKDYPGKTVARLHYTLPKPEPTDHLIEGDLAALQERFGSMGFVRTDPHPWDDPVIVEVWL